MKRTRSEEPRPEAIVVEELIDRLLDGVADGRVGGNLNSSPDDGEEVAERPPQPPPQRRGRFDKVGDQLPPATKLRGVDSAASRTFDGSSMIGRSEELVPLRPLPTQPATNSVDSPDRGGGAEALRARFREKPNGSVTGIGVGNGKTSFLIADIIGRQAPTNGNDHNNSGNGNSRREDPEFGDAGIVSCSRRYGDRVDAAADAAMLPPSTVGKSGRQCFDVNRTSNSALVLAVGGRQDGDGDSTPGGLQRKQTPGKQSLASFSESSSARVARQKVLALDDDAARWPIIDQRRIYLSDEDFNESTGRRPLASGNQDRSHRGSFQLGISSSSSSSHLSARDVVIDDASADDIELERRQRQQRQRSAENLREMAERLPQQQRRSTWFNGLPAIQRADCRFCALTSTEELPSSQSSEFLDSRYAMAIVPGTMASSDGTLLHRHHHNHSSRQHSPQVPMKSSFAGDLFATVDGRKVELQVCANYSRICEYQHLYLGRRT